MNPITKDDIIHSSDYLTNPEYLICTTKRTHDAIHFGDKDLLPEEPVSRKPNDTVSMEGITNGQHLKID